MSQYLNDNGFETMESLLEELASKQSKLSAAKNARDQTRLQDDVDRLKALSVAAISDDTNARLQYSRVGDSRGCKNNGASNGNKSLAGIKNGRYKALTIEAGDICGADNASEATGIPKNQGGNKKGAGASAGLSSNPGDPTTKKKRGKDFGAAGETFREKGIQAVPVSVAPSTVKMCHHKEKCKLYACKCDHGPGRKQVCSLAENCMEFNCDLLHPSKRLNKCTKGVKCVQTDDICGLLHPPWCSLGCDCCDFLCTFRHPQERLAACKHALKCISEDCRLLHPPKWNPSGEPRGAHLKTFANRMADRVTEVEVAPGQREIRPNLPIFDKREDFVQRLRDEKVLVVTAETGSGKTTQLPQYCAESFEKLIVCTQPRMLAAFSVANRIADEFDGTSVGHRVGYCAKGCKIKKNQRIVLMTDATLVWIAQSDPTLSFVDVLIIDEAHERSLNTDIVLGIAKGIRQKRPDDFHVVIASATIDPARFLDFFFPSTVQLRVALQVPGRTFPVHLASPVIPKNKQVDVLKELLVDTVVSSLQKFPSGHCLVFLPGAGEIERAIKDFRQHEKYERAWETFPLYGGMPPEEQQRILEYSSDGLDGRKRMVVFCTNVAETSLTVPNVRLVIDTGLAKEARFDQKRRMTVLEQVLISKSSATQRMGRAGRMCEGTCVQLFDRTALLRDNIEPEILRSSLDMVVLQLSKLGPGFEPSNFPFLDRPDQTNLLASQNVLRQLGCLTVAGDVTALGNLFNDLPFDPRLSRFVMDMHEAGHTQVGVEIAALISAPGSVHFMGGSDKIVKQEKQRKIAVATTAFDSDLLFLHSVYDAWKGAGTVSAGKCLSCTKKAQPLGCSRCRTSLARTEGLNNMVCEAVLRTCRDVSTRLNQYLGELKLANSPSPHTAVTLSEAIGRALVVNFPEQVCEVLLPSNPDLGAHIFGSGMKGQFSDQSCVSNNRALTSTHVLAMSVMQTPSGILVLNNCHPLQAVALPFNVLEQLSTQSVSLTKCFERTNLHLRFKSIVQQTLVGFMSSKDSKGLGRFILCVYDRGVSNQLTVYAPRAIATEVCAKVSGALEDKLKSELDCTINVAISSGSAQVTVASGLRMTRIDMASASLRVKITTIPRDVNTDNALWLWLTDKVGVNKDEIQGLRFNPVNPIAGEGCHPATATVVFKTEEIATAFMVKLNRVQVCNSTTAITASGSQPAQRRTAVHDFSMEESWGRLVTVKLDSYVRSVDELRARCSLLPAVVKSDVRHSKVRFAVALKNLPEKCSEQFVRLKVLAGVDGNSYEVSMQPARQFCHEVSTPGVDPYFDIGPNTQYRYNVRMAFCNFATHGAASAAVPVIQRNLAASCCPSVAMGDRTLAVEVSFNPPKEAKSYFDLYFASSESASKAMPILRSISCQASGKASLSFQYPELFDLEAMKDDIAGEQGVVITHDIKPDNHGGERCVLHFTGGDPTTCGRAARKMKARVDPIVLRLVDRQQQQLFTALVTSGQIGKWVKELGLKEKIYMSKVHKMEEETVTGITIYGPAIEKGLLMRRIAESNNKFSTRYKLVPVGKEAAMFKPNRSGSIGLERLQHQFGATCRLRFVFDIKSIEVLLQNTASVSLSKVVSQVDALLLSLGVNAKQKRELQDAIACVYCAEDCGSSFSICGHHFCRNCLSVAMNTANRFPICCPVDSCRTPLSVRDMSAMLEQETLTRLCTSSARSALQLQRKHHLSFCPNQTCEAILPRASGYISCPSCRQDVCTKCSRINTRYHRDKSCEEFMQIENVAENGPKAGIDFLLKASRTFLQDNWVQSTLGPIVSIDVNPALQSGAPSFQKYLAGATSLGDPDTVMTNNGLFAWHGTKNDASIVSICHNGFNPERRSGQAYGPGEYFGCSADISHGYADKTARMLVCHLLRSPVLATRENFCYIVNNPLESTQMFCVAVLVVTYGIYSSRLPKIEFTPFQPVQSKAKLNAIICYTKTGLDSDSDSDSDKSAPPARAFRWMWKNDDSKFNAYTDNISAELELAYSRYASHGLQEITIGPLVRFVDDTPQHYRVNFRTMQQINAKTQYVRDLRRERQEDLDLSGEFVWEYCNERSRWRPVDSMCQNVLQTRFEAYLAGYGTAQLADIEFAGRPEKYTVSFAQPMTQTNQESKAKRLLRRVSKSERHARSNHFGETVVINMRFDGARSLAAEVLLRKLNDEIESIVRTTMGAYWNEWDLPLLTLHPNSSCGQSDQRHILLGTYALNCVFLGLTKSIGGMLVGRLLTMLASQFFARDVTVAGDSSSMGVDTPQPTVLRNPRLMQMATSALSTASIKFNEREQVVLYLAHTLVWQLGCTVYGGFVRDWVIRGEPANDIDVKLPDGTDSQKVAEGLTRAVQAAAGKPGAAGLQVIERKVKGAAFTVVISGPWQGHKIEVDLVSKSVVSQKPGVDADVDNFAIDATGQLTKRVHDAGGLQMSLIVQVKHCLAKQFVSYYDLAASPDMVRTRLKKLFDRGWTCIGFSSSTGVDGADYDALLRVVQPQHRAQVVPQLLFCKPWAH
eukprot:gene8904-10522_t